MINLFQKLFLVKEIKSKDGVLHFRRYRLLWTPWFAIYIHRIYKSDDDLHPHSHPWNFISLILSGAYCEELYKQELDQVSIVERWFWTTKYNVFLPLSIGKRNRHQFHRITTLIGPVTSLVLTYGKCSGWGYKVGGQYVDFKKYRENKKDGLYEES